MKLLVFLAESFEYQASERGSPLAEEVANPAEGNIENSSGDDVFLMQKIHQAFKSSVGFVKSSDAIFSTLPQPGLSELINQRKRWASKWDKFLLRLSWILPVFLFIHYLSFIVGIALLIHDFGIYWSIGFLILIKILFDLHFLKKISNFIKSFVQ